jgi:hypothetical protein
MLLLPYRFIRLTLTTTNKYPKLTLIYLTCSLMLYTIVIIKKQLELSTHQIIITTIPITTITTTTITTTSTTTTPPPPPPDQLINIITNNDNTPTITTTTSSSFTMKQPLPLLTCGRPITTYEINLIQHLQSIISTSPILSNDKIIFFTLTTQSAWSTTKLHLTSLLENAPKTSTRFFVICIGQDTLQMCRKEFPSLHCILDQEMSNRIDPAHVAHSMSIGQDGIDTSYVEIIWRKPEIIQLFFLAGTKQITVVDSDGVWFQDPISSSSSSLSGDLLSPSNHGGVQYSLLSSGEYFVGSTTFGLSKKECTNAQIFRNTPLILNSGTVTIENNEIGNMILQRWMYWRLKSGPNGGCITTSSRTKTIPRESVALDQDGLNDAACNITISLLLLQLQQQSSTKTTRKNQLPAVVGLYSTSHVLLNSIHAQARIIGSPHFNFCTVWFFHATNCGTDKKICMEKNLKRRKDAKCTTVTTR